MSSTLSPNLYADCFAWVLLSLYSGVLSIKFASDREEGRASFLFATIVFTLTLIIAYYKVAAAFPFSIK